MIKNFPDIYDYIEYITLMGGAIGIGNISPSSEFNIGYDPLASSIVFKSKFEIYMIPIELTHQTMVP